MDRRIHGYKYKYKYIILEKKKLFFYHFYLNKDNLLIEYLDGIKVKK